jgi:site-specific DNA-methyltransferase (adenine-specific)
VDVAVTSPPYNLNIDYSTYDDSIPEDDYMLWSDSWVSQVHRILKPDGSFFLNVAGSLKSPMLPHTLLCRIVSSGLFRLQNTIHWVKSIAVPEAVGGSERQRGHYKPINSKRFLNDCHEYVFHLTKSGCVELNRKSIGVPYSDKSNIGRWGHSDGLDLKCRGNTWYVPYKTISNKNSDRPHPATFPVGLAEKCILLHGKPNPVVIDPFLGLGSSGVAAVGVGL